MLELYCNSEIRWFIFTFQKRKKTWSSRWRCTGDTWVSSRAPCCSLSPSPGWTRSLSATPMPCASGRSRNRRAKAKAPIPPKPNAKTVNPNRPPSPFHLHWDIFTAHTRDRTTIFKRSLSVGNVCFSFCITTWIVTTFQNGKATRLPKNNQITCVARAPFYICCSL